MPFPVQNIRDVCEERHTSIAEIERKLKIGNGVIARWEKGKRYPQMDRIEAIANLLKVPVSRLTGETEKPAPTNGDGLDAELLKRLMSLTPEEIDKVDAFVQGILAARSE